MNFKNWTLRFRDDKSWQISSSTKQVLLTKVGPLAKESIAGLALTLLHSVPSGYWQRRTLEKKTWINCENWIKICINISTCPPCAKVWSWHGFWGSPYSHQTGSCSWPGKKTWCVWHFCIAKYLRTNLNDFAATFWSLSSSKLSRSSKLTIWSSWNICEPVSKMFPRYNYMCVDNSLNHLWEDVVCSPDMPDVRVAILLTHAQYPNLHLELRI